MSTKTAPKPSKARLRDPGGKTPTSEDRFTKLEQSLDAGANQVVEVVWLKTQQWEVL